MSERFLRCPSCGNIVDKRFTEVNWGYCNCNTCGYSFDENDARVDFGGWCVDKIKELESKLYYLENLVATEKLRHIVGERREYSDNEKGI